MSVKQHTGSDDRCARVCSGVSKPVAGLQSHDDNFFVSDVDVDSEVESPPPPPSSPVAKKPSGRVHKTTNYSAQGVGFQLPAL